MIAVTGADIVNALIYKQEFIQKCALLHPSQISLDGGGKFQSPEKLGVYEEE